MVTLSKRLRVKDANEQVECSICVEAPGIVFVESTGGADERTYGQVPCWNCEGRAFVDEPVTLTILSLVSEILQQSKNLAAMQRSDMRNWVMKHGHVISLTQPSAFMAF